MNDKEFDEVKKMFLEKHPFEDLKKSISSRERFMFFLEGYEYNKKSHSKSKAKGSKK